MQILGINNYYQPKYLNTKQRKTSNIQQLQTFPDTFTFRGGSMLAVNGFRNLRNFENINNPYNKTFYEQLKQKLSKVPYYKHQDLDMDLDYSGLGEHIISQLYNACLDADKVVNKYAAQVLFNLCHVSSEKPIKEFNIPEWNMKEEKSKIFKDWGLDGIRILLEEAKDKKGNHNLNNLRLMLFLDKTYEYTDNPSSLADIFKTLTNEEGLITHENEQKFKTILKQPAGWYLTPYLNNISDISNKGMDFIVSVLKEIPEDDKGRVYGNKKYYIWLLESVLKHSGGKDIDKVYDILKNNFDFIIQDELHGVEIPFIQSFPLIRDSLNSKEQISVVNLEKLIQYKKNKEYDLYDTAKGLKDKKGIIRDENIDAYNIFKEYDSYYLKIFTRFIEEFTDKNGVIKKDFVSKLAEICGKYGFNSSNGYVAYLYRILTDFQNHNKPVDWDIVEMLCKYTRKGLDADPVIRGNSVTDHLLEAMRYLRDEKTGDIIPENVESFKKYAIINNPYGFKSIEQIQIANEAEEDLKNYFKKNQDYGNLYTAEDMLNLLRDLDDEELLNYEGVLTTPIKEGDSSILMYIADILPTEENAKKFDKIIKFLDKTDGINYNYKDEMGVSFLEKVMMSENSKLLELIKDKPLEYYPELEYAYKNIQNPEFKEGVNRLNFKLSGSYKEIGKSEKIEEKAKSIEEEKPLLSIVINNTFGTKKAVNNKAKKTPAALEDCHTMGDVIRNRRSLTSYKDKWNKK